MSEGQLEDWQTCEDIVTRVSQLIREKEFSAAQPQVFEILIFPWLRLIKGHSVQNVHCSEHWPIYRPRPGVRVRREGAKRLLQWEQTRLRFDIIVKRSAEWKWSMGEGEKEDQKRRDLLLQLSVSVTGRGWLIEATSAQDSSKQSCLWRDGTPLANAGRILCS